MLEEYEELDVSDECSSGVVRVVLEASPYLVCVGVQGIADLLITHRKNNLSQ